MSTELKIEYLPVSALKPYEKNARKHKKLDVDNIAMSIEKYGMNAPLYKSILSTTSPFLTRSRYAIELNDSTFGKLLQFRSAICCMDFLGILM